MATFTYGNYVYQYDLVPEERKTLALTVHPDATIVLKAPQDADAERVEAFLKKKWWWLHKQLDFFARVERRARKPEYVSGESFYYLGRQYQLKVIRGKHDDVTMQRGQLVILTTDKVRNGTKNKKLIEGWLKIRRQDIFCQRYLAMQKRFDYKTMPKLEIRNMAKRWGSFVTKEKIILNPKLIHTPRQCIDYVIVHELCHMKHKDHSKAFWKLLDEKYPNWQKVKEKLELKFGGY